MCVIYFTSAVANDLVVGTTGGYAPYVSLNAAGEYESFDIDIAKALAGRLGRKADHQGIGLIFSH